MPDRLEFAHEIIEEVFPKYGLGRYFIKQGKVFWRDVAFHRAVPLDAQLRVENERDVGRAVFVDLKSGVVRVRRLQRTFTVRLRKQTVEWIRQRLEEDAKLKLAFLGIEKRKDRKELTYGKLYIALVFAREAQPIVSKAIVAVYVNRLDHGMVIGIVKDRKIVKRYREKWETDICGVSFVVSTTHVITSPYTGQRGGIGSCWKRLNNQLSPGDHHTFKLVSFFTHEPTGPGGTADSAEPICAGTAGSPCPPRPERASAEAGSESPGKVGVVKRGYIKEMYDLWN